MFTCISGEVVQDMQCMLLSANNTLIMGGHRNVVLEYDIQSQQEVKQVNISCHRIHSFTARVQIEIQCIPELIQSANYLTFLSNQYSFKAPFTLTFFYRFFCSYECFATSFPFQYPFDQKQSPKARES